MNQTFSLRGFFEQERRTALRASFRHRFIPHDEIAIGVFQTAVKNLASFGPAFDQLTAASWFGTRNANRFRLDVLAFRVIAARNELTEAALFLHQLGLAALRARFV
jgi:hypothetical protein